jgi:hypothetical protein
MSEKQVGCENKDGTLNIHNEAVTCAVCAPPSREAEIRQDDTCSGDTHRWPHDYQEGDTCNCGAFYVLQSSAAGLMIERAPDADES